MAGNFYVVPQRRTGLQEMIEAANPYLQQAFQMNMQRRMQEQQRQEAQQRMQQFAPEIFSNYPAQQNLASERPGALGTMPESYKRILQKEASGKPKLDMEKAKQYPGLDFSEMGVPYKVPQSQTPMGIYTISPEGIPTQTATLPKGSRTLTPSQLETPQQKIETQAKGTALKEAQVNLAKVERLGPIVDTIEKEWLKTKPQSGPAGRISGIGKLIATPAQLDKNTASYRTFVKGMRAQLARAMGDVGNLSEPEQKAAMDLVPSLTDNFEVGNEKINKVKNFIAQLKEGNQLAARQILYGDYEQTQQGNRVGRFKVEVE